MRLRLVIYKTLTILLFANTLQLSFAIDDYEDNYSKNPLQIPQHPISFVLDPKYTVLSETDPAKFGDNITNATPLDSNTSFLGKFDNSNIADYFVFTLDQTEKIIISTEGHGDTLGDLLNNVGELISTNDDRNDCGATNRNFSIVETLDPATYYIRVRPYTENDEFTYKFNFYTITQDPPNDIRDAFSISINSTVSESIIPACDKDYYSFELSQATNIHFESNGNDLVGIIRDEFNEIITFDDDSGIGRNFSIRSRLDKGIYYLGVEGFELKEAGEYSINVNSLGIDHGDLASIATKINVGQYINGYIDPEQDLDYFKLELDREYTLTISTEGQADTFGAVFDSDLQLIVENDDFGVKGNFLIHRVFPAGIYYIRVTSAYKKSKGLYRLSVLDSNDDLLSKYDVQYIIPAVKDVDDPDLIISQRAGLEQIWFNETTGAITHSYSRLREEENGLRVFYTNDGVPTSVVDEVTGERIRFFDRDGNRVDVFFYDESGKYTGGFGFFEENSRYYIGSIHRLPAYYGEQLRGHIDFDNGSVGSFTIISDGNIRDGLVDISPLPIEFNTYVTELGLYFDDFFDAQFTVNSRKGTDNGTHSTTNGAYVSPSTNLPKSTRRAIVRLLSAGAGITVAYNTGTLGDLSFRLSKRALTAYISSPTRGYDALYNVINALVDEASLCKSKALLKFWDNICEVTVDLASGDISSYEEAFGSLGKGILGQYTPKWVKDAEKLVKLREFTEDVVKFKTSHLSDSNVDEDEGPSKTHNPVKGSGVLQDGRNFDLLGLISSDSDLKVTGCPHSEPNCEGDEKLQIDGMITKREITGEAQVDGQQGRVSGSVETIGKCESEQRNSGGQGAFSFTHFIGNGDGSLRFYYDTYTIPDRVDLYTRKGERFSTGGLVGRSETVELEIEDEPNVHVNISAPRTNTEWEYTIYCLISN